MEGIQNNPAHTETIKVSKAKLAVLHTSLTFLQGPDWFNVAT